MAAGCAAQNQFRFRIGISLSRLVMIDMAQLQRALRDGGVWQFAGGTANPLAEDRGSYIWQRVHS
jgi:hypothetical protein